MAGTPARNGYWYTYNDDNPKGTDATCIQTPPSGPQLSAPAMPRLVVLREAPATQAPSGRDGRRVRAARDVDGLQRLGRRHRR